VSGPEASPAVSSRGPRKHGAWAFCHRGALRRRVFPRCASSRSDSRCVSARPGSPNPFHAAAHIFIVGEA
jgi:hypothetical protein